MKFAASCPSLRPAALVLVAGVWALCLAAGLVGHCFAPDALCPWVRASFVLGASLAFVGGMAGFGALVPARVRCAPRVVRAAGGPVELALPAIGASARLYERVDDIPADAWERAVAPAGPFMRLDYLRALASALPASIRPVYGLLLRDGRPAAAACFQVIEVRPAALGADVARWRLPSRVLLALLGCGPRGVVRALVAGNVLHTRTGGFQATSELAPGEVGEALAAMTEALRRHEDARGGGPIALTMLKDLTEGDPADDALLRARGYHRIGSAQPTMELHVPAGWRSFDDYLAAMSAKYRKRAKAARRKGAALRRCELSEAALLARAGELRPLLDAVVARAEFKLTPVSLTTITCLKRQLGERLVVTAYEHDGAAVGFAAALIDGERLEALFVGLDYEVNAALPVYQNMLYDFVEQAIRRGCRTVHLGRTALEIKSTVGAEPTPLRIYLRHPGPLMNLALGRILGSTTAAPWVQRRPFKAGADDDGED
jgi:hypothetical protein